MTLAIAVARPACSLRGSKGASGPLGNPPFGAAPARSLGSIGLQGPHEDFPLFTGAAKRPLVTPAKRPPVMEVGR